jgi:fructose-1,6-bisphosphatase I
LANEIIIKAMDHGGRLCAMASEEEPGIIQIPEMFKCGKYALLFDPLDGSSNIDVNVPVGTIFSVVRKITRGRHGELEDMLQPGRRQVAAGYVIYGSSTMMVYTTGQGAHGFTLDPSIGEFLLSHPNIKIPDTGRYLSVNDSYEPLWDDNVRAVMRQYKGMDGDRRALSTRYVGSLVADFHRNLLGGGIFAYPANKKTPKGKLRLLYEANPLAFIVEQAGGLATNGSAAHPRRGADRAPSARSALYREQERGRARAANAQVGRLRRLPGRSARGTAKRSPRTTRSTRKQHTDEHRSAQRGFFPCAVFGVLV